MLLVTGRLARCCRRWYCVTFGTPSPGLCRRSPHGQQGWLVATQWPLPKEIVKSTSGSQAAQAGPCTLWTMDLQSTGHSLGSTDLNWKREIWVWGSSTCLISFYDIHLQPPWNSLPSMNPLIKLPVALIAMLPHSRENFVWLSRDYFNVFHVKLVSTF